MLKIFIIAPEIRSLSIGKEFAESGIQVGGIACVILWYDYGNQYSADATFEGYVLLSELEREESEDCPE